MNKKCELCNHKMFSLNNNYNCNILHCYHCNNFTLYTNKINHNNTLRYKFKYYDLFLIFDVSDSTTISLTKNDDINDEILISYNLPNILPLNEIKNKKDYFYNRLIKLIPLS